VCRFDTGDSVYKSAFIFHIVRFSKWIDCSLSPCILSVIMPVLFDIFIHLNFDDMYSNPHFYCLVSNTIQSNTNQIHIYLYMVPKSVLFIPNCVYSLTLNNSKTVFFSEYDGSHVIKHIRMQLAAFNLRCQLRYARGVLNCMNTGISRHV
jgi:hypothetical protein